MSVQVENLEKNMVKLTIEVSAEDLEKALQAVYMKEKSRISLPETWTPKTARKLWSFSNIPMRNINRP